MRLNVGAGTRRPDGYFNVDVQEHPDAPKLLDAVCHVKSIPLPDECADELMAIHLWEHLYRWECDEVITEWKRLLKSGGLLVLELPDLMKCCKNIIDGRVKGGKHPDQLGMWGIFGDPRTKDPHMNHCWGWTPSTLEEYLVNHGFRNIQHKQTMFHPAGRSHRDMRIEAIK
jgi:hypothetical protein